MECVRGCIVGVVIGLGTIGRRETGEERGHN